MMKGLLFICILFALTLLMGLTQNTAYSESRFKDDVEFLKKYVTVILLKDTDSEGQVAVVPEYQGRIMTSTAEGLEGLSFGWINRELISSKKIEPHINVFGGEDRFWIGPEGGQYGIFFPPNSPFDLDHWQTPPVIDTEPYEVVSQNEKQVSFHKEAKLKNWTGTDFQISIERTVSILSKEQIAGTLGVRIPQNIKYIGVESKNRIKNIGNEDWNKEKGLLSIWILGMFNPSPDTTIVIPFLPGAEEYLGPKVNDAYFGKVPPDRLVVKDNILFFKGDGQYRSKIGVSPKRALSVCGSYDAKNKVLTIVQYSKPDTPKPYVNSMWEMQKDPYGGDVINSYNDGPLGPGKKPLGPFYELETSSPAEELKKGEFVEHTHKTFHFIGDEKELNYLANEILGVDLQTIQNAFSSK
ncbi:MAG TPA: hypothetical protein PLJ10_03440 [Candidatus Hydrogenedens sp.]|nr:hypothetical protein [Candidatus Hydrogenedens sp.]HOK08695.1 hypothetical protein [Candidatus Hydrogenedens sp.]